MNDDRAVQAHTQLKVPKVPMKVVGFCGFSGSGKTTVVEQLVQCLKQAGQRVSVVKHAHHAFDIDQVGKDSWRHRQAGASEVVIASDRRLAKMREYDAVAVPTVHDLIAELSPCDWVLVEGFKRAEINKIEVWRASTGQPVIYANDLHVLAICTDSPTQLPHPTQLPVLDLNDAAALAGFLLSRAERFEYVTPARVAAVPTASIASASNAGTHKRAPLLTLEDALGRLLHAVAPPAASAALTLSTFDALGRILAQDVCSALDVPPADNTSMDGYALRRADVPALGAVLPVSQRIPAGVVGTALQPGTAARVFTGAQVPEGADAVVMQEQCEAVDGIDGHAASVRVNVLPAPGQWIRRRGEDVRAGAVVLAAGTRLTPQALGLAASVGAAELQVARRPRVALFSTGDELVMPGQPLKPGAIYNSNRYTLRALIQAFGCDCVDLGIVPDRLDATRAALRRAALEADLIVTSGGVSVGEEDHLRPAVQAEGQVELWQIAIKPGKPFAFGAVRRDDGSQAHFVGLPGNPVSSFVTFLLLVRPLLLRLQGATALAPTRSVMRADFDWPRPDVRREFLRVRRNEAGGLDLFANQSSGVLTSAVWGDGLLDNPGGHAIRAGDSVAFLSFSELMS